MKVRKYQARQMDPRAVVVPLKDHERALEQIKGEVARMLASLNRAGSITNESHDYWKKRISEL